MPKIIPTQTPFHKSDKIVMLGAAIAFVVLVVFSVINFI